MPIRVTSRPTVLFPLLLLIMLATSVVADCPSLCECKWKNGKESVRCHNANLTEIPPRLDAGTQVLDLQRNEIIRLDGDDFSTVNLVNLQKIYLIDCQLTYLHRFAFRNLINLVELDLSENRLAAVPSHVFDSMAELRELRLSGNPMMRLDNFAFNGLAHLVRLELSNCRIRRIELRAFEGVRQSLEWLKLDGNEMINVQPAALTILNNLHGIELTRNNWNCTCTLRPLREWMLRQNIPYEVTPVCATPERVKGKPWARMDVDEFACPPTVLAFGGASGRVGVAPITTTTTTTSTVTIKAIEGHNVTIGCEVVAGNPDPTIRWMFRNRVIVGNVSLRTTSGESSTSSLSFPSSQATASSSAAGPPEGTMRGVAAMTTLDTRKKFYHHLSRTATNVTIAWIDNHDSGVYKCIAENEAGRSEATISVLVYSRHYRIDRNNNIVEASMSPTHSSNRFIFIISTIVAVLFVLLSLLLAVCYYTVHKKKRRAEATAHYLHRHGHTSTSAAASPLARQQNSKPRKVLNKTSFNFLLCQSRSESYEKIEMLATSNAASHAMRTERARDETSFKIYSERRADEVGELEMVDDMRGLTLVAAQEQVSAVTGQSIQDKRRSMSLNLSNSPSNLQQQKRAAASRRRNGDYYSEVPTTAEEDMDASGGGLDKLMAEETSSRGRKAEWKLLSKHQAQAAEEGRGDNPETLHHFQNNEWLNGQTESYL